MTLPFFVYGTLLPGGAHHDRHLRGRTRHEEPAVLPGAVLYPGPGYPYAVEEPPAASAAGPGVRGGIVTPHPGAYAELLAGLDELEEYVPGDPNSPYVRVARAAVLGDGTRVRAWVYVAGPAVAARLRAHGRPITGGDWRAYARAVRPPR
ncbi:gamma-glutamylcyclotransferase [Streptomyces sp. NPDC008150]|uniref:gamma-glutamylcyclotransferase family protein n=1 Tax=Streptomyces sp. NPDC008150 TaxID=3364816 RepID=UPI0036EC4C01